MTSSGSVGEQADDREDSMWSPRVAF
jgi:hypothetical protein